MDRAIERFSYKIVGYLKWIQFLEDNDYARQTCVKIISKLGEGRSSSVYLLALFQPWKPQITHTMAMKVGTTEDEYTKTALLSCIESPYFPIVYGGIDSTAPVTLNNTHFDTDVIEAVKQNDIDELRYLVSKNANLRCHNDMPLSVAIQQNNQILQSFIRMRRLEYAPEKTYLFEAFDDPEQRITSMLMEQIPGDTWKRHLTRWTTPEPFIICFLQVLTALHQAQIYKFAHNDLNTGNIIIRNITQVVNIWWRGRYIRVLVPQVICLIDFHHSHVEFSRQVISSETDEEFGIIRNEPCVIQDVFRILKSSFDHRPMIIETIKILMSKFKTYTATSLTGLDRQLTLEDYYSFLEDKLGTKIDNIVESVRTTGMQRTRVLDIDGPDINRYRKWFDDEKKFWNDDEPFPTLGNYSDAVLIRLIYYIKHATKRKALLDTTDPHKNDILTWLKSVQRTTAVNALIAAVEKL